MSIFTYRGGSRTGGTTPMFISRWDTTQAGSANDTVVLPLVSDGSYDFYVDWGDGNRDNITGYNQAEVTHQYSDTGIYEVRIYGGITGWEFANGGDKLKISSISRWGPFTPSNNSAGNFLGCSNLTIISDDELYINSGPDAAEFFFALCPGLSSGPINVSIGPNVTSLYAMFLQSQNFNEDIGYWDTSSVTDMSFVLNFAISFDQDLGNWDTSNVTTMAFLFDDAYVFNNGGSPSISGWNTSKVVNMQSMFEVTEFNQPIGSWDTSSVTNISSMLRSATGFDQDLSNWIVTGVTSASFFLDNGTLSTTNYDLTLSGWAQQSGDLQSGVSIDFGTSQYSIATGEQYKEILSGAGWTIVDGGSV